MRLFLYLCLLLCISIKAQQITLVEYWFNDDYNNRQGIPITADHIVNGEVQLNIPYPDNETNQLGHTIHYQFFDHGFRRGPIVSQQITNPNDQNVYPVELEYWFDDDFVNKQLTNTAIAFDENGFIGQSKDISWPDNAQNLHYRFKSKYNQWSGIYTANKDLIANEDNQITEIEYWVGDDFTNRQSLTINNRNSFFLDRRELNLSEVETVHLRYKDKIGRWSSIYSFDSDYQGEENEPSPIGAITLTTTKEEGGLIRLNWNSVENGTLYQIYRNGKYWRSFENTVHPENFELVNYPVIGTHEYQVVAKNYLNPNKVESNIESEEIIQEDIDDQTDPVSPIVYGALAITVMDDQARVLEGVQAVFSHDGATQKSNSGAFIREGLAYGVQGTATISKPGYIFESTQNDSEICSYNVNSDLVSCVFIGHPDTTDPNFTNIIEQSTPIEILTEAVTYLSPFEAKVTIKNIGNSNWSGIVKLGARKIGTTTSVENINIVDEVLVSDLAPNTSKTLEFYTNVLLLQPSDENNYRFSLQTYRNEGNINSQFGNLVIPQDVITNPALTYVGASEDDLTIDAAKLIIKNTLETSQIFTGVLFDYSSSDDKFTRDHLSEIYTNLETTQNLIEAVDNFTTAINTVDGLMEANDFKDYWKALSNLTDYCPTTSSTALVCPFLKYYSKTSHQAFEAIDQIENLNYVGVSNLNFIEDAQIRLKVFKTNVGIDLFDSYFDRDNYINQINQLELIGVNSNKEIKQSFPFTLKACNNSGNDNTVCFSPPSSIGHTEYLEPSYRFFIKLLWQNGKITYVPFGTSYIDEHPVNGDFTFKLDGTDAAENPNKIQTYAKPIFN